MAANPHRSQTPAPRPHLVAFAQTALRAACAADPMRFFAAMASPERCRLLSGLWQQVERSVGTPLAGNEAADTRVTTTVLRDRPAIVVALPTPHAAGEAIFAGLVLTGLPSRGAAPGPVAFRYFTLDAAADDDATELCEWTDAGRRQVDEGPAPTIAAFLLALEARL
jgi:hypothetical protein